MKFSLIITLLILFFSCKPRENKDILLKSSINSHCIIDEVTFASGFTIRKYDNFKLLEVYNPWQGADGVKFQYLLYHSDSIPVNNFPEAIKIKIPIKRIICLSTTHIGFIAKLNELKSIVGISNKDLVYNKILREKIDKEQIVDVGYEQSLNHETMMQLHADLVMAYGVSSEITGVNNKLSELGIKTVFNAEYLEKTPLAKAEWIKFVAAFYDKDAMADSIFDSTVDEYNKTKNLMSGLKYKPTILTGLPWKGTWYVPGSKSYAVKLIEDAGGSYLWNNNSHEATGLNIESVFEVAQGADIWINPGASLSYEDIISSDERLKQFKAFQLKAIYNNNKRTNESGGNDYWESGIVNPQIILADLISIIHPENIEDYSPFYYQKLK